MESSEGFPDFAPARESLVSGRRRICYLRSPVIDLAQGNVAKLIDAASVLLLWRVARGRASEQERQVAAMFPALLHIPTHVHLPAEQVGAVNSVVGTWTRENLLDYFAAGPGGVRGDAPAAAATWSAAVGAEAAFPTALPVMTWLTREAGRPYAFALADDELFDPDELYLARVASWYHREAQRTEKEDRDREAALSSARIAELWLDSARARSLEQLNAFELETRLRRMGMAGGDVFAQRFGWSHTLIGLEAVRAFNRHLAPWAAASLMPEPFRLGMVDRCLAHPGCCAVLLAASAAAQNLDRAAADRATAPRSLPMRGVRYAGPAGGDPPDDALVHRLIKGAHGIPVFSPMSGNPDGLWEMFIAIRVERTMRPEIFRQPSPLGLRRTMDSIHGIIVRVGAGAGAADDEVQVETVFVSDTCTVADVDRQAAASEGAASRAVRALWRARR